jgi:AmmeMemoRadiSam system protein B
VRRAACAGQFYPAGERQLSGIIESLIASVRPQPLSSSPSVLIVPHAGYPFSGQTAAYAYKTIKGRKYDTVVMVGASHYMYENGAAVYVGDYWRTPLGEVPVDADLASRIIEGCEVALANSDAHSREHSLEVQLPFLQKVLRDFKILPIVTSFRSAVEAESLTRSIIDSCRGKEWLLLTTSDLYHGYSYEECLGKVEATVKRIIEGDPDELARSFSVGESSACGEGALLTALYAARLLDGSPVLLHQTNSGDVMGSRSGYIVGYCSVAFV